MLRWIGGGLVRDEQQTTAGIETFERWWDRHGFGMFALELRASGELIGFAGLAVPQLLPEVMPPSRSAGGSGAPSGGATEAAAATLRFGLIGRHLGQVISIAQVGNGASEHIMGKLGMRLARETR